MENLLFLGVPILKHIRVIRVLPFLINPRDVGLSYKMDLDFLGLSWKGKKLNNKKHVF